MAWTRLENLLLPREASRAVALKLRNRADLITPSRRRGRRFLLQALFAIFWLPICARALTVEEAVAVAKRQNLDIAVARKQLEAARGSLIEARSGYFPSVLSTGLARKREHQTDSRLRDEDYNASVRVVQNLYTGGAVSAQTRIARLKLEKQAIELQAVIDRVAMDVRVAYYDSLLGRAKVQVREKSVTALQQEAQSQRERQNAGTVGALNVRRAEVAVASEQPELIDAQTQLQNSYVRLQSLLALDAAAENGAATALVTGQLHYAPQRPDLNECLAYADATRPEILAHEKDVEIADQELELDRSELRPHVEAFSGYEAYSERDPQVGREFNHGYVFGLNASWHLFDGFATQGRMQATRARRAAAVAALQAVRNSVAGEVRSAFLDLQQSDRVLRAATKSVQNADESIELAHGNLSAGLGTQLDILQANSDVTRTRTTRLTAIYLQNVALARLARATARDPEALGFAGKERANQALSAAQLSRVAEPPANLRRGQ